jgi:hypothetical protein
MTVVSDATSSFEKLRFRGGWCGTIVGMTVEGPSETGSRSAGTSFNEEGCLFRFCSPSIMRLLLDAFFSLESTGVVGIDFGLLLPSKVSFSWCNNFSLRFKHN